MALPARGLPRRPAPRVRRRSATWPSPGNSPSSNPTAPSASSRSETGTSTGPNGHPTGSGSTSTPRAFTTAPGHAQLARIPDGRRTDREAADSDTVDWFPHSPQRAAGHLHQLPDRHPRPPRRPRRRGPYRLDRRLDHSAPALPTVRRTRNPQRQQLGARQQPVRLRRVPGRMTADPTAAPSVRDRGLASTTRQTPGSPSPPSPPAASRSAACPRRSATTSPPNRPSPWSPRSCAAHPAHRHLQHLLRRRERTAHRSKASAASGVSRPATGSPPRSTGRTATTPPAEFDAPSRKASERLGLDHFPLVYLHDPEYALDQGTRQPRRRRRRAGQACGTKASSTTSVSPAVTCT